MDESGSLVLKPALPREIAFYQLLSSSYKSDPIHQLKPFVPLFYGTMKIIAQTTDAGAVVPVPGAQSAPESIVLENLSNDFTHPTIFDVKLGRVLYDEAAPPEKKARMDKAARATTSHETGVRLTAGQTWHHPTESYIVTPKAFGKSITAEQLHQGIARFFPLPGDTILPFESLAPPTPISSVPTFSRNVEAADPSAPASTTDAQAQDAEPTPATAPPTPVSAVAVPERKETGAQEPSPGKVYTQHAVPAADIARLLEILLEHLDKLIQVIENLEARFVGMSLLVVYESDPARLKDALTRFDERQAKSAVQEAAGLPSPPESPSAFSRGSSDDEGDGGNEDRGLKSEMSMENIDGDEDDGVAADARRKRRCPPVVLKMIDFAHTRLAPGEGPDEGVLAGLYTFRILLEGRLEEAKEAADQSPALRSAY